jgi:hypothetical protein
MKEDQHKRIIKFLLTTPANMLEIRKSYSKSLKFWQLLPAPYVFCPSPSIMNDLEKKGFIISDMSEEEFKVQYALGTLKYQSYYVPDNARKILEKLYGADIL